MLKIKQIGASKFAIVTMAAVLAASGAAYAAGGGDGGSGQGGPPRGQGGPGGAPGGGHGGAMKYLTYSEVHTYRRGAEKVIRTDAGKVTAVSDTSITLSERDGNSITRALDADTDVHIRDNQDATASDLAVGDTVVVNGEKDQAADDVGVRKSAS